MQSRTSARNAAAATAAAASSAVTVLALAATGAVFGLVSRPSPPPAAVVQPAAQPQQPKPKRTVYVRVPAAAPVLPRAVAPRRAVVQPAPRAPRRAQAPAVTTSSGS